MRLPNIDRALASCSRHLHATESLNTEIDTLLAAAILVRMYAEFESFVKNVIEEKARAMGLEVKEAREKWYRGMLSSQLSDGLSQIEGDYKTTFNAKAHQEQRTVTFYNNVISNRHSVAHGPGASVTVEEIASFYKDGHVVLDWFRETLLCNTA